MLQVPKKHIKLAGAEIYRKSATINLAIFIFSWIYLLTWIPSPISSLGITSLEDGPVLPSLASKNPAHFQNDFRALESLHLVWTSSSKWIPVLLYKYMNLNPTALHFAIVFLQTFLIFLGVYKFTKTFTDSNYFASVVLGNFVLSKPYFINAGWYGDLQFMPYTTWSAIGPVLLSWANYRKSKNVLATFWMVVGASIHPAMALLALLIIFLAEADSPKDVSRQKIIRLVPLTIPIIAFGITSKLALNNAVDDSTRAISAENLRNIQHFSAWRMVPSLQTFPIMGSWVIQTLTHVSILFVLRQSMKREVRVILRNVIVISCTLVVIQAIAYSLNISEIYAISLGRVTIYSQIVIMILFTLFLLENLCKNPTHLRKDILSVILFVTIFPAPVVCLITVASLFLVKSKKLEIKDSIFLILIFIFELSIYSALVSGEYFQIPATAQFFSNGFDESQNLLFRVFLIYCHQYWFIGLIALITFFVWIIRKIDFLRNRRSISLLISSCVLATLAIQFNLSTTRDNRNSDWIQVQLWALKKSHPDDVFLVNTGYNIYESWGTLSKRPRLILNSKAGYPYFYSNEDKDFDNRVIQVSSTSNENMTSLKYYLEVGKNMGANYAVFPVTKNDPKFKICYRNSTYWIYSLNNKC